jgi:hypothetical protein
VIQHAVKLIAAPVRSDADIERAISSLGDKPTTGLLVAGEPFSQCAARSNHLAHDALSARHDLPLPFFLPSGVV